MSVRRRRRESKLNLRRRTSILNLPRTVSTVIQIIREQETSSPRIKLDRAAQGQVRNSSLPEARECLQALENRIQRLEMQLNKRFDRLERGAVSSPDSVEKDIARLAEILERNRIEAAFLQSLIESREPNPAKRRMADRRRVQIAEWTADKALRRLDRQLERFEASRQERVANAKEEIKVANEFGAVIYIKQHLSEADIQQKSGFLKIRNPAENNYEYAEDTRNLLNDDDGRPLNPNSIVVIENLGISNYTPPDLTRVTHTFSGGEQIETARHVSEMYKIAENPNVKFTLGGFDVLERVAGTTAEGRAFRQDLIEFLLRHNNSLMVASNAEMPVSPEHFMQAIPLLVPLVRHQHS